MNNDIIDDLVKLKAQYDIVTEQLVQISRTICTKLLAMRTGGLDENLFQTYIRYYHRCLINIDDIIFDGNQDFPGIIIKGCEDFDESQVAFFYKDTYEVVWHPVHGRDRYPACDGCYYTYYLNRCT